MPIVETQCDLSIGRTIKQLRKQRELSQRELAALLDEDYVNLTKVENDSAVCGETLLVKVANFFGVDADYLAALRQQTKAVGSYYVRRDGGIVAYPIPVVTNGRQTGFVGDNKLYIGRANRSLQGSPLANPFKIGRDGDRDEVVAKYRCWLWREYKKGGLVRRELEAIAARVKAGEAVELVCWCAPQKCHGDVVARCVGWILSREVVARTSSIATCSPPL